MVTPKKHLGQHFLNNRALCEQIVSRLDPSPSRVLEIGPGAGALTSLLTSMEYENFIAVEADPEAARFLKDLYPGMTLLEQDVLNSNWDFFEGEAYQVISNLPYNISSPVLFKILEHRALIQKCVLMTQKEVAERILSPPGSKVFGILSVLVQSFFKVSRGIHVSPGNFNPPPKVQSLVFDLNRNSFVPNEAFYSALLRVVKAAFNQRRKKLRNALSAVFPELDFVPAEFLDKRAEQLSVDDFLCMTGNLVGTPS